MARKLKIIQPFNREPQIRYQYKAGQVKLTASALWQLQYLSSGPNGMSEEYIKNSCVPEFYLGADHASGSGWLAGGGVHLISLKPRTSSLWNEKTYKVNERMTALSYEAHVKYTGRRFSFAAKSLLASCLDHTALSMILGSSAACSYASYTAAYSSVLPAPCDGSLSPNSLSYKD